MSFENLVFEGGGVKGMAYAGAIEVLEQRGLLTGLKRVGGASAGAITAALLALGITSQQLHHVLTTTPFASFMDGKGWIFRDTYRLVQGYGLYEGNTCETWLREQLATLTKQLTGTAQSELTFGQLRELVRQYPGVCRELYVVTTNLTRQLPEVFCADSYPDVSIAQAVRMSMSIPFFFEAVHFGGNVYIDGGVSWNYPIDLFDGVIRQPVLGIEPRPVARDRTGPEAVNAKTLGFNLGTTAEIDSQRQDWQPLAAPISNLREFVKGFVNFMLHESNRLHADAASLQRTVFIDNAGVSTTDFELSPERIATLVDNGRKATSAWLDGLQGGTVPAAATASR
jgi:NTE family protein